MGMHYTPSRRIQSSGHLLRVRWRPLPRVAARVGAADLPDEGPSRPKPEGPFRSSLRADQQCAGSMVVVWMAMSLTALAKTPEKAHAPGLPMLPQ
jgi:hypothetical protein